MPQLFKDSCYESGTSRRSFIEFHFDEQRRKAFSIGHLITYSVDPNPDAVDSKGEPPDKLHLAFSTADVYVLGWRLDTLANNLREDKLYAIAVMPKRYADMDRKSPFVSSIVIKPIGPELSGELHH
jgi:hypothetical protein